jgi:hypothetical protein
MVPRLDAMRRALDAVSISVNGKKKRTLTLIDAGSASDEA